MKAQDLNELIDFIPYFNSFYGKKGLYSAGRDFTAQEIFIALHFLFTKKPDHEFMGDSLDRELIRDILIPVEQPKTKGL